MVNVSELGVGNNPFRTQKARGIRMLKSLTGLMFQLGSSIPAFTIVDAKKADPKLLVGYFCRPCPVTPRHGFVESRHVKTVEEAQVLIDETLKADAEAEIVSMPKLSGRYSAIWTVNALTIGEGNAGATAGKKSTVLPTSGNIFRGLDYELKGAGIEHSPFLEIVYHYGRPYLVQLRDGPKVNADEDSIPSAVTVKEIVNAEGDLLDWEQKCKAFKKGTIVYSKGGSLFSHYAIHALLNSIPVVTSHKPSIGEKLGPNTTKTVTYNPKEVKKGFLIGATMPDSYVESLKKMITTCHHTAKWGGRLDRLIGVGLGCAFRLTVCASLGEYRHSSKFNDTNNPYSDLNRDKVYEKAWTIALTPKIMGDFITSLWSFKTGCWHDGSYGGKSWFNACINGLDIYNYVACGNVKAALTSLNRLVNAAHNGGWLFDKFGTKTMMDDAAQCPSKMLIGLGPDLYQILHTYKLIPKDVKVKSRTKETSKLKKTKQTFHKICGGCDECKTCGNCSCVNDEDNDPSEDDDDEPETCGDCGHIIDNCTCEQPYNHAKCTPDPTCHTNNASTAPKCGAHCPHKKSFFCTLDKEHAGMHHAHTGFQCLCVWPKDLVTGPGTIVEETNKPKQATLDNVEPQLKIDGYLTGFQARIDEGTKIHLQFKTSQKGLQDGYFIKDITVPTPLHALMKEELTKQVDNGTNGSSYNGSGTKYLKLLVNHIIGPTVGPTDCGKCYLHMAGDTVNKVCLLIDLVNANHLDNHGEKI